MSSPPAPVLPQGGPLVDLSSTYGPILIGILFSAGLLGITINQAWTYYNNFPKDKPILKIIVYFVVFMEALRLGFAVHGIYYYLVAHWGNPLALANLVWTSQVLLIMSPLTEIVVRLYFSYRVWIMSQRNRYLTAILVTLSLTHLSTGAAAWRVSFENTAVQGHTILLQRLGFATLGLAIATDWCISLSLIYFLNRNRSGMSSTNSIINRIVFYTVNMGLITSCMDITILALTIWDPAQPHLYSIALLQVVANLYANSLLASLNSRIAWRTKPNANVAMSDFSAFEARSGHETESTAADLSSNGSKEKVQSGHVVSFGGAHPSSGKHGIEHSQSSGYEV
ncbi:hypothetical protein D9619_008293 [Psilocybe cf. subviscida]|uniref:DUF6534 domain-containing protein n=1 Tax=Psilocybe cf. subviscida TaxID=2480587 RepID=A0A8H5F0Y8_9AGAR|nr:hypothetical protein D9619_008309 [Psilocybe cf. subviscida]KAF5319527.1 hypothetical protein D9619_008293 [Psilocybe cf. subviscida]